MAPLLCADCGTVIDRDVIPVLDGYVFGSVCRECHTRTVESRTFAFYTHALLALWQHEQAVN